MYDYLEQVTADVRDYVEQEIDLTEFFLIPDFKLLAVFLIFEVFLHPVSKDRTKCASF